MDEFIVPLTVEIATTKVIILHLNFLQLLTGRNNFMLCFKKRN